MKIIIDGEEYEPNEEESKAVKIEMWYDRHRKNWVLYPVDKDGNQLKEAVYGFGKKGSFKNKKTT